MSFGNNSEDISIIGFTQAVVTNIGEIYKKEYQLIRELNLVTIQTNIVIVIKEVFKMELVMYLKAGFSYKQGHIPIIPKNYLTVHPIYLTPQKQVKFCT